MKKMRLSAVAILTTFMAVTLVHADTMPEVQNGKILLTGDITLGSYTIPAEVTEIDLGTHTLTINAGSITNGQTEVTIKNGKVVCEANAECIINNNGSKITIDTVQVSAMNTDKGAVVNNGEASINNSTIKTKNETYGKVLSTSLQAGNDYTVLYNVENSLLEGYYAMYTTIKSDGTVTFNVNGGEIKGTPQLKSRAKLNLSGNISVPYNYVNDNSRIAIEKGARVTMTSYADNNNIIVPEGVTLVIPEEVKVVYDVNTRYHMIVKGTVEGEVDANVYDETTKSYFGGIKKALIASAHGSVIKVLKDFTEPGTLTFEVETGSDNKHDEDDVAEFILDLNGHNVTATVNVLEDTSLTIEDTTDNEGTITGTITNNGTLEINGGNYTNLPEGEGSLTLTGGKFKADLLNNTELPEGKELQENEDGTVTIVNMRYNITIKEPQNGKVTTNVSKAEAGEIVEITYEANEGYTLATLKVIDKDGKEIEVIDGKFVMPDGIVTIEATFKKSENPKTGDNILTYLGVGIIATAVVSSSVKKLKKEN